MTLLTRRPKPGIRQTRAQLEAQITALETARDRAIGQRRAALDWITSWLESRAAGFDAEAAHLDRLRPVTARQSVAPPPLDARQYRLLAGEIRACIRDFQEGPQ